MLNREHVTDALRFWEPARIGYNLVLALITAAMLGLPLMSGSLRFQDVSAASLIVLAVLANVAYCFAYPVDLFVQASDFRSARAYWRIAIWSVGTLFAAALAWLITAAAANPLLETP